MPLQTEYQQGLNLFKTYMVLGPNYRSEVATNRNPMLPKPIVRLIMQYVQYNDWEEIAKDLARLLNGTGLNFITRSESWAQDPSLSNAKKWLANPHRPLITASYNVVDESIMPLIEFLAKTPFVDATDAYGRTALMIAAIGGYSEILKALLRIPGFNVNKVDIQGSTALMYAANRGHVETLKILLAVPGIAANAVDKDGSTALMWAAFNGHVEALKVLLGVPGIDVNAANKNGSTALTLAETSPHMEIIRLINEHLAQLERDNQNKCTIF